MVVGNSEFGEVTKTGLRDDTVLFNSTDRPFVAGILRKVVTPKLGKDERVFPLLTLPIYEDLFRKVGRRLDTAHLRITPHTVRHSGPSWDRLQNLRTESQIKRRGRWACERSLQRYKKPGRLLLFMSRVPALAKRRMKSALTSVLCAISSM